MEGGEITERGTHQQLLQAQGKYQQMWLLQQEERKQGRMANSDPISQ